MALDPRRRAVLLLGASALACALNAAGAPPLDLNTASLAQLEALGGVGTALAGRLMEERARRPFADWADAQRRVKGLGPKVAAQLSDQGMTINGAPYVPAPR